MFKSSIFLISFLFLLNLKIGDGFSATLRSRLHFHFFNPHLAQNFFIPIKREKISPSNEIEVENVGPVGSVGPEESRRPIRLAVGNRGDSFSEIPWRFWKRLFKPNRIDFALFY